MKHQHNLFILAFLSALTLISPAVEIGGTLQELDPQLKAKNYSKLPADTKKLGDNYYCVVLQQTDWDSAKKWCEERGGHLATITSKEENNFLAKQTKSLPKHIQQLFIGGTDKPKEGTWTWITNEPFKYQNWAKHEPSNSENREHFMTMVSHNGGWNDAPSAHDFVKGFIIEWEGASLVPKKILSDPPAAFPKELLAVHSLMQKNLTHLKKTGNNEAFLKLVKSYGKKIVTTERKLTRQRKLDQAKAVRSVKLELIALLNNKPNAPEKEVAKKNNVSRLHVLIDKGVIKHKAEIDKNKWKKRGKTIESTEEWAGIFFPDFIIGKGDFKITATVKVDRIGSTWPKIKIGETETGIDAREGRACMRFGAFYRDEHKGEKTAGTVVPNHYFDWILERKGTILTISVNNKQLMQIPIHAEALGKLHFKAGKSKLTLKKLTLLGNIENPIKTKAVIAKHNDPDEHYTSGMVIQTKDNRRICLFRGYRNSGGVWLRTSNSRDAGVSWEKPEILEENIDGKGKVHTSSAAYAPSKKSCLVLYTRGESNQHVHFRDGRNYGRNWSKPIDITLIAKKVGWDVIFTTSGITTQHGTKKDRTLIPYHGGKDTKDMYLLASDNGKNWQRIGPVIKETKGTASITEMQDGTLIAAAGGQASLRTSISNDGGKTWSSPSATDLTIAPMRGTLTSATTSDGKEILLYAGSLQVRGDQTNDLYLWASSDKGKSWKKIGILCYGPSYHSNLIALEPGKIGLFVRAYSHWSRAQQRYHIIDLKLLGL